MDRPQWSTATMEVVSTWLPAPRWKQHAALSGYIYQYIFEGSPATRCYMFLATSGPAIQRKLTVALDPGPLTEWEKQERHLTDIECYGVAKMALMRALDEAETPALVPGQIEPSLETIGDICRELDF